MSSSIRTLLLACTIGASIPMAAMREAARPEITQKSPVSMIDSVVHESQKQLNQLSLSLSTISHYLNNPLVTIDHKQEALLHIKALNSLISSIAYEKFAHVDADTSITLVQLTKALSNHIDALIKTKCAHASRWIVKKEDTIESIAPDKLLEELLLASSTRSPQKITNPFALLASNEARIKRITKAADSFGLKWYNRLYRKLDDAVFSPALRYSVPSRSLLAGGSLFLSCYVWWRMFNDHFQRNAPALLIQTFGNTLPDHMRPDLYPQLAPIGKAEYNLGQVMNGWMPIGKFTAGAVATGLFAEWKFKKSSIGKKIKEWHHRMRGGSSLEIAKKAAETVEKVFFSDIFGQEEIIRYFKTLVEYLANPEPFDRLNLTPSKGVLCVGDTRTGKTYAVTALFNEIEQMMKHSGMPNKFKFHNLSATVINEWGIKTILQSIKQTAPCVVFIDEIDLLNLQRVGNNQTLSEFLTCMSGALNSKESKDQVIIIAATNKPENLDVALRQPGRFGKELRFEYPNQIDRAQFISHKLDKLALDLTQFDIDHLAQITHNKSYEALKGLIDNALLQARIAGQMLTQKHIEKTLEQDLYHIIPNNSKEIPDHEKEILSAHFAGQALALMLLDTHTKLSKVTIKQVMTDIKEEMMGMHLWDKNQKEQKRFEYGKIFVHRSKDSINLNNLDEKIALCKFYLAGFAAEEILLGSCGYSCHAESDTSSAFSCAQSIVLKGLDFAKLPEAIKEKKHAEIMNLLDTYKQEIAQLLANKQEVLAKISDELKRTETLNEKQVRALMA